MQSRFGVSGLTAHYLIPQGAFDAWANSTKSRTLTVTGLLLLLVAIACSAAIAVMGPRLVREGSLLWLGSKAEGAIKSAAAVRVGAFKDGAAKYQLTIDYDFVASDGSPFAGQTQRSDVRTPPEFVPGDPIGVYYDRANPLNSVADHNLRTDVYALLLFLPWIALFGIALPLFYLRRWWNWRQQRSVAGHTQHKPHG